MPGTEEGRGPTYYLEGDNRAELLPEAGDDREGLHNGKMTEGKGNQFRVEEKFRTLNHIKKQCIQEPFVFVPAGTQ